MLTEIPKVVNFKDLQWLTLLQVISINYHEIIISGFLFLYFNKRAVP